jgi:hypothetical protein
MKYQRIQQAALSVMFLLMMMVAANFKAKAQGAVDKAAKVMTDSLAYLNLTDAQKTEAMGFNKTAATALGQLAKKAQQDTSLHGKALAKQVMGIMKQRNVSLGKILNADQTKLFQEHKLQQMAELQTKVMTTQLNLTEAQVPQVYQVNLKSTKEMMEDMGKLKEASGKFKKMKAAKGMKSDSKDKDKEMKKILNADQYAKYEKNKEEMQAAMKEKMQEKKAAAKG